MNKLRWGTTEELRALLTELVSWKSMTLSEGERQFPMKLQAKLQDLDYFQEFPEYLSLHNADIRRKFLTALYKHPEAKDTICLISHFDTVNTEEYGDFEPLATQPEELTKIFLERKDELLDEVVKDLESGEYLFGRGTMDMKMGLVMHMSLIEKASIEKWPINLLLLTVPDEEVNSSGMRYAVPTLLDLQKEHGLTYKLFLNGEPVFEQKPGDHNYYIYSGAIGKILPAALFYGKETHAGEPLSGLTSPYIASFLTQQMEWNDTFQETSLDEKTPVPVTLQQKDLRLEYSTQTPYRSAALYNVFLMERNASEIMALFERVANEAATACNEAYFKVCKRNKVDPIGTVKVMRYKELLEYATNKFGIEFIEEVKMEIYAHEEWDDREKSFRITDKLMIQCQELAPSIIILFAPPYYPAVNSTGDELVEDCIKFVKEKAFEKFHLPAERIHYFNGICDLSYVNYTDSGEGWTAFESNTPVWGDSYTLPFKEMKRLNAPVLNIGPFGKDAHKRTERLHIKNAFEQVPLLVEEMIHMISKDKKQ
ncbi:M20/M25/M40 family metallo-hydrolase [Rossellomorea sp. BNER]|uniref:M20/M25/M40 family metallo-hydrolase n=1 Tax=Rossellomorea sp. BNER TaxID=2962031 RepID=UPI003AF1F533|nr:M20/M25/M40 family metallo-hydrolase [Rossellomorea sp. BNER]